MKKYAHILSSLLIFITGFAALNPIKLQTVTLHHSHIFAVHLVSLVLGFLLVFLALQIFNRKRIAYLISFWLLALLIVVTVVHKQHLWLIIVSMASLVSLTYFKDIFTVKSNNLNLQRSLLGSGTLLFGAFLYATMGFYFIEQRAFGSSFTLIESARYAFVQLFTFTNIAPIPLTRHAHLFLLSLDFISVVAIASALVNIFKPVRFGLLSAKDRTDAQQIITSRSNSVEDFFKLWPADKHYFFNKSKTSVLAYKVSGGSALVLDGPSGSARSFKKLLTDFTRFSENNGWNPAVIHADDATKTVAETAGYKSVFIGNEAIVDTQMFIDKTVRSKHFRYVENKAKREGLSTELWSPPLNANQLQQLREVSDSWLQTPGRREYTFVMGYFEDSYIGASTVTVLKQDEAIIAYANVIPSYVTGEASIDHMRHRSLMSAIGMHYLLKELIVSSQSTGTKHFNLGLSPLSGIQELEDPNLSERLLVAVKRYGSKYYSFGGLEQFKNKFKPNWEPRYILYRGNPTKLLRISNSLNKATELQIGRRYAKWFAPLAGLIGLSYLSFLLAIPLGISSNGYASELGALGAPYNWLFNGLDVLCGVSIIALSIYALFKGLNRSTYTLFAVAGIGTVLAALAPLHQNWTYQSTSTLLHVSFSAVAALGFNLAIILYLYSIRARRIMAIGSLSLLIILAVASLLPLPTIYDGIIQRTQLIFTAVFIALISFRAFRVIK